MKTRTWCLCRWSSFALLRYSNGARGRAFQLWNIKVYDNFEIRRSFATLITARIAPETSEIFVEVFRNEVNFCANKKQTIEARAPKWHGVQPVLDLNKYVKGRRDSCIIVNHLLQQTFSFFNHAENNNINRLAVRHEIFMRGTVPVANSAQHIQCATTPALWYSLKLPRKIPVR